MIMAGLSKLLVILSCSFFGTGGEDSFHDEAPVILECVKNVGWMFLGRGHLKALTVSQRLIRKELNVRRMHIKTAQPTSITIRDFSSFSKSRWFQRCMEMVRALARRMRDLETLVEI